MWRLLHSSIHRFRKTEQPRTHHHFKTKSANKNWPQETSGTRSYLTITILDRCYPWNWLTDLITYFLYNYITLFIQFVYYFSFYLELWLKISVKSILYFLCKWYPHKIILNKLKHINLSIHVYKSYKLNN